MNVKSPVLAIYLQSKGLGSIQHRVTDTLRYSYCEFTAMTVSSGEALDSES